MGADLRLPAGFACAFATAVAVMAQASRPASGSIGEQLARYQPGVSATRPLSRDALWSGAGEFRREATAWIAGGGAADAPRRRLLVATYVLDLLKDVEDERLWQDGQSAPALVDWACARLRDSAPLPAERAWHVASLALLERSSTVTVLERQLDRAEMRVPDGDRWPLVRALTDEWRSEDRRRDDGTLAVPGGVASRAAQHFEQAASRSGVRQEALLRWAAYESDLGKSDAALARLDRIGQMDDPFLRYWTGLVKGRVLRRLNRPEDAIAEYRSAVAEFPSAQSGALGLAAALVGVRHMTEASAVVTRAIAAAADSSVPDPWKIYRSPDVRLWPGALDELRAAVTP
jgi:tetratricopeptide (TPR) repeat protein